MGDIRKMVPDMKPEWEGFNSGNWRHGGVIDSVRDPGTPDGE